MSTRAKTQSVVFRVDQIDRAPSSKLGNPAFYLSDQGGNRYRTVANSSAGWDAKNVQVGDVVRVELTARRTVAYLYECNCEVGRHMLGSVVRGWHHSTCPIRGTA